MQSSAATTGPDTDRIGRSDRTRRPKKGMATVRSERNRAAVLEELGAGSVASRTAPRPTHRPRSGKTGPRGGVAKI